VAGYTTAAILGQLGADVVKIEPLDRPEVLRSPAYAIGPVATEPSGVPNTVMNASLSRATRNLAADISTDKGRALFLRLVEAADVVVENLGPGSQKTLGVSFEALSQVNPRIVLTSLSGYGRTGPRSSYLAYATNISNFTGMSYEWDFCHGTLSDYVTAAHASLGTLAALRHVRATGEGVWVDAAQTEAMTAAMPQGVLEAAVNGRDLPPPGNTVPGSLCSGVFGCKGFDAWVAVDIEDLADWASACDLFDVPLHVDSVSEARELQPALEAALHGWAAERTAHTAAHQLQRAGLAAGVVQSMEDIWRDPQIWAREFPVSLSQPDLGTYYYGDSFYRLSETPGRVGHVGHRLGQDTSDVLSEWLGMGGDEIQGLLDSGAAFQG
jgi:benzylsuccinate CoA-transferase BbsF subunit